MSSSNPADPRERTRTRPTRRRRGLRVPLTEVKRTSALDELRPDEEELPTNGSLSIPTDGDGDGDVEASAGVDIESFEDEPTDEYTLDEVQEMDQASTPPSALPIPRPPPPIPDFTEQVEEVVLRPWFEDFFGEHYLRTVRQPTAREVAKECDFIERALGVPVGAKVLDVGCGLGLHAVELASRGYQIVGVDISMPMLTRATDEAEDRGLKIKLLEGDMRQLAFEAEFDAILCWGTTFGYFDDEGNESTIDSFYRALKPDGVLLLDVVNRDYMIASQPNTVWFEVNGSICMEETSFNYKNSRLRVKRNVVSDDGGQRDREYSIRLYALHEVTRLLEDLGFRVDQVSGRRATMGVFFGVHSPEMILRAVKQEPLSPKDTQAPPPPPVPKR